ncbi:MAG: UDP-N-acetylglucosamine diphosphorylase/glucosamine-1-phosphate N-acetyltransferase [Nitrospiraceae bacterium]|nr:MAG: UDP-N-acetylglucosamine diphosphorylase/glucosamine-1-phosphate N-acetyltransferase [Nitrospiraceae bacterium]
MSRSRATDVSTVKKPVNSDQQGKIAGLAVVVMAAGLGKRMCSKQAKVLHPVAGQALVLYSVGLGLRVAGDRIAVVVGHQADLVRQVIAHATGGPNGGAPVTIVEQREQLGTGHAVLQSRPVFGVGKRGAPSRYLILNGDTPLLQEKTLRELLRVHETERATVTILTAVLTDASGYGRVVRANSAERGVSRIVEDRDADAEEQAIREVNVGTYVVDGEFLFSALEKLDPSNAQGEYYLTEIIHLAVAQGHRVAAVVLDNPDEGLGVNTRRQLADAEQVVRHQIRERWLDAGVTMIDPASVWIDATVTVGKDTVLYPNVTLEGTTVIGEDCVLRSSTRLKDCTIGNGVEILDHCVCADSHIEDGAHVGPFVHLRPGVVVRKKAKVGNFVEMKKTDLGEGSKANHLSYLGDAQIGKGVNIGAGTITCNYDGVRKSQTVIGDGVFLGSDTQLIAPVTVGAGAIIAAGTTVTEDVPADALAIGRVPQVNRQGWAARRRALQAGANRETLNVKRETKPAHHTEKQPQASKGGQVKKHSRG